MNNPNPIYLSHSDYSKLRLLVTTVLNSNANSVVRTLRDELDRAAVVEDDAMPAGVVTLESRVEFEDLTTGEVEEYTITLPERARVEEKRLSILAPIGIALIGCRAGDVVQWATPGGMRQLKIRRVSAPVPESAPSQLVAPALASIAR
jgi:regulator of nucleoside diphosphate kinase